MTKIAKIKILNIHRKSFSLRKTYRISDINSNELVTVGRSIISLLAMSFTILWALVLSFGTVVYPLQSRGSLDFLLIAFSYITSGIIMLLVDKMIDLEIFEFKSSTGSLLGHIRGKFFFSSKWQIISDRGDHLGTIVFESTLGKTVGKLKTPLDMFIISKRIEKLGEKESFLGRLVQRMKQLANYDVHDSNNRLCLSISGFDREFKIDSTDFMTPFLTYSTVICLIKEFLIPRPRQK